MRPPQVVLNIGTPPGSPPQTFSDFEVVDYPPSQNRSYSTQEEKLPLYNMHTEEKTRRRLRGQELQNVDSDYSYHPDMLDSDEGKDVYNKMKMFRGHPVGRPRYKLNPPPTNLTDFIKQNLEHIYPAIYTLLSCWTRFYQIGKSNTVVWDEAHFGKFGSYYIRRTFYFDVHPPLGKMLVGLVGLLSGYDGSFEFESGATYPENVPFTAMRVMLATFGVAMVPLAWYTSVELGMSRKACHLITLMVLCDVAWLCISRFILLDSMLLFFTLLTVFCLTKFHNEQYESFTLDWWIWLAATGYSIGCVTSVKWVGAFVTALVGLYTIEDLWNKFGDLRLTWKDQAWHWGARIACLIVLPICVYMSCFQIHFWVLNRSGPGDSQMSSLFQANLVGNDFRKGPLDVAFGSKVTFKNVGYNGGLLHSHVQHYPVGSNQQQVTCYHYKDENNEWIILPRWDEAPLDQSEPLRLLKHGDVVRLQHGPTTRNLHSHPVPAPITNLNNEVSGYGNATIGDIQDHWRVEIVDDLKYGRYDKSQKIHPLTTRLRFQHEKTGCFLKAANAYLPEWGFKQIEVSCDKENDPSDVHTWWNVESHWNDRLPEGDATFYRSPFIRDFWHLNIAMMMSNNALIPNPDKEDILASKPTDWPFVRLGLRMCGWADNQLKYYLLGTPIIWWAGSVSLVASIFVLVVYLLRRQRKYKDFDLDEWEHFLYVGKLSFVGWFLHYAPFLIMGRVTYIHHYLPALYFSVLMVGHLMDHFVFSSRRLAEHTKWAIFGISVLTVVGCFWWFRGFAFGMDGPIGDHKGLQWRKSWNIYN